jgi:hypothetical protein
MFAVVNIKAVGKAHINQGNAAYGCECDLLPSLREHYENRALKNVTREMEFPHLCNLPFVQHGIAAQTHHAEHSVFG